MYAAWSIIALVYHKNSGPVRNVVPPQLVSFVLCTGKSYRFRTNTLATPPFSKDITAASTVTTCAGSFTKPDPLAFLQRVLFAHLHEVDQRGGEELDDGS